MVTGSGFVDLQINGALGINFTAPGLTAEGISKVCQALARDGTIAFCPAVTTAPWEIYEQVMPLLVSAIEKPGPGARPLGIHIEGPFISAEDGAVGAHRKAWTQVPSVAALERFLALGRGKVAIITVAPELPGCAELIAAAVRHGVKVSLGHTKATVDDVARAVDAGATLATHVGNGCTEDMHHHTNPILAQLDSPLSAMVISDGHHVPAGFLRMVAAMKGPQRLILTSDAAPCAGQAPGIYDMFGTQVELTPGGAVLNLKVARGLAGSGSLLFACANHAAKVLGWNEADMWRITRDNPLAAIGRKAEDVIPGGGPVRWNGSGFTLSSQVKAA